MKNVTGVLSIKPMLQIVPFVPSALTAIDVPVYSSNRLSIILIQINKLMKKKKEKRSKKKDCIERVFIEKKSE